MSARAMLKLLKFDRQDVDSQTGSCTYAVTFDGKEIAAIDKGTVWCGDGYGADSYDLRFEDDDVATERDECFEVDNIWSRGGTDARTALKLAKDAVRAAVRAGVFPRVECSQCDGEFSRAEMAAMEPDPWCKDCDEEAQSKSHLGTDSAWDPAGAQ